MVYMRGKRRIRPLAQLGNRGWSYQDVLRSSQDERYEGGSDKFRGRNGLLG